MRGSSQTSQNIDFGFSLTNVHDGHIHDVSRMGGAEGMDEEEDEDEEDDANGDEDEDGNAAEVMADSGWL